MGNIPQLNTDETLPEAKRVLEGGGICVEGKKP
jgi:hypothetical protein